MKNNSNNNLIHELIQQKINTQEYIRALFDQLKNINE